MSNQNIIAALEKIRLNAKFPQNSDEVVIDRAVYSQLIRVLATLRYEESKEVA